MGFVRSYGGIMQVLQSIETGKCSGRCKTGWIASFRNACKSKVNDLKLTPQQKKTIRTRIKELTNRKTQGKRTIKKYATRKSPPYPANDFCGKTKKGNDGNQYISTPNKNGVCSWKKA